MIALRGVTIAVADAERARDWHRAAVLGADTLALLSVRGAERPPVLDISDPGAVHVCLRTADIGAAHDRLRAAGARFATAPQVSHAGPSIAFFRDPAGVQFQLIELAGGPLATGPAPPPVDDAVGVLHHVGMTVADLDEAVDWYERELGLTTVVRSQAAGDAAAGLLGLREADYRAAVLAVGDHWLELMAFERPSAERPAPAGAGAVCVSFASGDDRDSLRATAPGGFRVHLATTEETG